MASTAVVSPQQHSHVSQQRFHHQEMRQISQSSQSSQSSAGGVLSPEGELKDVEADFQSLVNEMVQDGSKRAINTQKAMTSKVSSSSEVSSTSSTSVKSTSSSSSSKSFSVKSSQQSNAQVKSGSHMKPATPKPLGPPRASPTLPHSDSGLVKAVPAWVVPEPDESAKTEILVEKPMKVRDRIKKLEKQFSEEEPGPSQPPDVLLPRSKSGSIKNLADQYEAAAEEAAATLVATSVTTFREDELKDARSVKLLATNYIQDVEDINQQKKLEGNFKSVKDVASTYSEPITPAPIPIRPPAAFSDEEQEPMDPVAVLPPAMRKPPPPSPPPKPAQPCPIPPPNMSPTPFRSDYERTDSTSSATSTKQEIQESVYGSNQMSETLTNTSSSDVLMQQEPIQYSAQVKCEVRTRVTTPEIAEQYKQNQTQSSTESTRKSRSETRTSSSANTFKSAFNATNSSNQSSSALKNASSSSSSTASHTPFPAAAPHHLARAPGAKPPKGDSCDTMPKFSLLRSASTGSVVDGHQKGMTKARSEKDIKFSVKRVRAADNVGKKVWSPGGKNDHPGPSKIEVKDLPSFNDVAPVWTPRAGSASPSLDRNQYRRVDYDGRSLPRRQRSQESSKAPRAEESYAWRSKENLLPRVQSPTVTLLQKKRDGQIPGSRPEYLQNGDPSFYRPDDKLYTIKREYESDDDDIHRKFAVLAPKRIEGVGPTTRDGVPVTLKSGVRSEHQGEWYRRMFDSLHKVKDVRGYGGYMSEPEGYDSDYGTSRYGTLDRQRNQFDWEYSESGKRNSNRYVHQPGRIEDYIPGFSSLSEKELKNNPETEVKLEIPSGGPPPINRYGGSRHLGNALRDVGGYESDSTLVFRKKEDQRKQYLDTRQAYKHVQSGGEIPLEGLQKPAPPKPKVRLEQKAVIPPEELQRRNEDHMRRVYEEERRKKYLQEVEDIERRRHTDHWTPLHKSPIALNRYDDDSFGGGRGPKTPEPRQMARALFNFSAQNKRELSFQKGDVITIRRQIDKNWNEGEVRGLVGIFPTNYIEIIPFDSLKSLNRKPQEGQARARFNFQAQTQMEMSLSKGEIVILTRRVDDNWYEGRVGNRRGIFPVSYVDTMHEPGRGAGSPHRGDPMGRPALPPAHLLYNGTGPPPGPTNARPGSQNENKPPQFTQLTVNTQQEAVTYRSLYNYKPQNDDELELLEGDTVCVMEKCDDGWFVGTSRRTGLFGTFPGNYVEKVQ